MIEIVDFLIALMLIILFSFSTNLNDNYFYSNQKLEELKLLNNNFSNFIKVNCNDFYKDNIFIYRKLKEKNGSVVLDEECFKVK